MERNEEKKVKLVCMPLATAGHLASPLEFLKLLMRLKPNKFSATIITTQADHLSSCMASVADSGLDISFHVIPAMDPSKLSNPNVYKLLQDQGNYFLPRAKSALKDIHSSTPVSAVLIDLVFVGVVEFATDLLGIDTYIFYILGATMVSIALSLPTMDSKLPPGKNLHELEEDGVMIDFPGLPIPLPPTVLPSSFSEARPQPQIWKNILRACSLNWKLKGYIVNTFTELQPFPIKSLESFPYHPDLPTPPVYPVGPIVSLKPFTTTQIEGEKHECLRWLDGQPPCSVVYICFGSQGHVSKEQVREIAAGLEKSGHRFLWILRDIPVWTFGKTLDTQLDEVLPQGFVERTKEKGMVWPSTAPQIAILEHVAIGGFVTHCGWNSVLESVWAGVPTLPWPLHSEQHLNAFEMVHEMGISFEFKVNIKEGNWVAAEEVERGVRCLMEEGCCEENVRVRAKIKELKEKGRRALQEGGSSFLAMEKLAEKLISDAYKL